MNQFVPRENQMRSKSDTLLQFTLKEYYSILDRLAQALDPVHLISEQEKKTFRFVYTTLIVLNQDLKIATFDHFIAALRRLQIPEPELNKTLHNGSYNGSYYAIPNSKSDPVAYHEKMTYRHSKLKTKWDEIMHAHNLSTDQVDYKLMPQDNRIDMMERELVDLRMELHDRDRKKDQAIEVLMQRVNSLEARLQGPRLVVDSTKIAS